MVSPQKRAQRRAQRAAATPSSNPATSFTPQPTAPPQTSGSRIISTSGGLEAKIVKGGSRERTPTLGSPRGGSTVVRVGNNTPRHRDSFTVKKVSVEKPLTRVVNNQAPGGGRPVAWTQEVAAAKEVVKIPEPPADVTVVLSVFERPSFLREQYESLQNQTRAPAAILAVASKGEIPYDERTITGSGMAVLRANVNIGAWARFSMAMEVPTKYVCILDDDTIPGPRWIEAAMARLEQAEKSGEGPLCIAASGEVFRSDNPADSYRVGPESARPDEMDVDIGHGGWIFRKDLLRHFMSAPRPGDGRIGWSMHLSALLSMEDVITVVLPYEYGNTQAWGMIRPPAKDDRSVSFKINSEALQGGMSYDYRRAQLYAAYREMGWKPMVVLDTEEEETSGE